MKRFCKKSLLNTTVVIIKILSEFSLTKLRKYCNSDFTKYSHKEFEVGIG